MAQSFEEGNKSPHSSLWKEMPSSGEGGAEDTVGRGPGPGPPAPWPEVRGRPPLVVCLQGKGGRRGEKPKVGLAEGLTGNSTTLA